MKLFDFEHAQKMIYSTFGSEALIVIFAASCKIYKLTDIIFRHKINN